MKQKKNHKPVSSIALVKPGVPLMVWLKLLAIVIIPVALLSGAYWLWDVIWPSDNLQAKMKQLEARDKLPPKLNPPEPPGPAPDGMVWVPGGEFWMGYEGADDSAPIHKVYVDGFWMDKTEVTNEQWAKFVAETKYVTVAERKPDPKDFPDVDPKELENPFSLVFRKPKFRIANALLAQRENLWWNPVHHASWQYPEGRGSDIRGKDYYPVVHICWDDAVAFCKWAGRRLPTEAESEFAARGGLDRKMYFWGDELKPEGKVMANVWEGEFPNENTKEDGYDGLAPVAHYPANGYGLHDMAGNVWEWCADWYQPNHYMMRSQDKIHVAQRNPQGPSSGFDPNEPGQPKRVQRGGSYLCAENYCTRYVAGTRGKGEVSSATNHLGFRCVKDAK
jgi:sulfatase modifying factor 1